VVENPSIGATGRPAVPGFRRWPGRHDRGTIVALTSAQRIELYERIKRTSLGEEGANVVMDALPNLDWDRLATRDDLTTVRAELGTEMADLRTGLRTEMADLRTELRTEIADLRTELHTGLSGLRGEMTALRADMRTDLVELENRIQRSMITWILAAQGVTLAATSLLVTVLAFTLG